jgi:hypothetical protein
MVFRSLTGWFAWALILGLGLAGTSSSPAANYNVFSGQSIQSKINAATNGDTITIYAGLYSENLTISGKDVRLLRPASQAVTLSGNITFSGITNAYTFGGFTIGGMTDKTLTISNCPKMSVYAVTMAAGNVSVTGSNTTADFARCTITGNITVASSVQRMSLARSTVTESLDSSANETLVAYSTLRWFRQRSTGKAILVGNTLNERLVDGGRTVEVYDSAALIALNNIVRDGAYYNYNDNFAFWISGGASLNAFNNVIFNYSGRYADRGFHFEPNRSSVSEISSNIGHTIQDEFLYGSFNYINALYNLSSTGAGGGVYLTSHISADPLFTDTDNFVLGASSPARDAGNPDPRFNDIDGTRNDMGIYGGPFYDPDGRSGSKPVVLKAELDNTQFVKGDLSSVKLKAAGAATGSP